MKFQVTEIEFDFASDDEVLAAGFQEDIIADTKLTVWDAEDAGDLIEEITCSTGYCVKSVNYEHIL